jgi:hypothetical protein
VRGNTCACQNPAIAARGQGIVCSWGETLTERSDAAKLIHI